MLKQTILCAALGAALLGAGAAGAVPAPADKGMEVQVSGSAALSVPNDEAVLSFSVIEEGRDAKSASEKAIARSNAALSALKKSPLAASLESMQTAGFSVNPRYTQSSEKAAARIDGWEAAVQLRVVVRDVEKTGEIMALAGESMDYDGVSFRVSRKARQAAEAELLNRATLNAVAKLNAISKTMGLTEREVKMTKLTVMHQTSAPRYFAMAKTAAANAAARLAPQVEGGTSEVELHVNAEALIMPAK